MVSGGKARPSLRTITWAPGTPRAAIVIVHGLGEHAGCHESSRDLVDRVGEGQDVEVFLDRSPFYAEAGGQVGDTGVISAGAARFEVEDTIKLGGSFFGHIGRLISGVLEAGQQVSARIDAERRRQIDADTAQVTAYGQYRGLFSGSTARRDIQVDFE